ncbi:MAG: NAD(P)H-binding protein [Proteobacteria bacterium]|nr:NAD(P)H-binding protein [Pseudomonadota bacterium]
MKLTVFGATGLSGRILTRQALDEGYKVTAYARNPSKIDFSHPNLKIVQGELNDMGAIKQAVEGADTVISLLGPPGRVKGCLVAEGMANIVKAMKEKNINRLIATATPSASDPNDSFDLKFSFAVMMIRLLMGDAYVDIVKTAGIIRESGLNWTIVRLPFLNNKQKTGKVNSGYTGKGVVNFTLSRNDLVDFILAQVNGKEFMLKAPAISN